jgi:hypothetical protein
MVDWISSCVLLLWAMKIPSLEDLPRVAQGSEWARKLNSYPSTITRAYQSGALKGSKIGRRTVLFSREDIFEWLGLEVLIETPAAPTPRPIERIVAKAPVAARHRSKDAAAR